MIITNNDHLGVGNLKKPLNQDFEMNDVEALNYFFNLEASSAPNGYYLPKTNMHMIFNT